MQSVKMLALAFHFFFGVTLLAEGFVEKIPEGYIHFSMTFSVFVKLLNIGVRRKKKTEPVHFREPIVYWWNELRSSAVKQAQLRAITVPLSTKQRGHHVREQATQAQIRNN